jgi:hypothetical protein
MGLEGKVGPAVSFLVSCLEATFTFFHSHAIMESHKHTIKLDDKGKNYCNTALASHRGRIRSRTLFRVDGQSCRTHKGSSFDKPEFHVADSVLWSIFSSIYLCPSYMKT